MRAGYAFTGWWTAATGGVRITSTTAVSTAVSRTFHAQWTPEAIIRTVNFNSNGGDSASTWTRFIVDGTTFHAARTSPTRIAHPTTAVIGRTLALGTGNDAHPWFSAQSGGSRVSQTETITSDRTVWARWQGDITFNANGGTHNNGTTANRTIATGTAGTYASAFSTAGTPTRTGHTFAGWWNTSATTGGTEYTAATLVTGSAAPTLWARWTPVTQVVTTNTWDGLRTAINNAPANVSVTIRISGNITTNGAANPNAIEIPADRIIAL